MLNAALEQKVADRTHDLETTLLRLEQQQELAKALAAERELGELKSRFVSMASHEFRTPLTAVLISAMLIKKYTTTEQQNKRAHHLQRLRRSVQHLMDILEEFLSVDKLTEGQVQVHPVRVPLDELVHEAVDEVQGIGKPGQRIEQHLQVTGPLWLDGSLLHKVLVNLLTNALKYSGEHQAVLLTVTQQAGSLTVQVQDQGIGMSREDQTHFFQRFFRARNATNIPGTGLGLHIVASYLTLLGGTIEWQSELNVGTTITPTIPYADHSTD